MSLKKLRRLSKKRSFLDYAIFLSASILVILLGTLFFKKDSRTSSHSTTPTVLDVFCTPSEIDGKVTFEGTAGSTYGKVSLQNISVRNCDVVGSNYLDVRYDVRTVRNLEIAPTGTPGEPVLHLAPGQTLYSQIRYQSSAQCKTKSINVLYAYRVSGRSEIVLKDENGVPTRLPVCTSTALTKIDIWPLSTSPISQ